MSSKLSLGNALIDAGEVALERGEFLEASAAFESALDHTDPLIVATAYKCLGNLAWQQGSYDEAFAQFEKARAIAIRHDAADVRARSEIGLGAVYYARGNYAKAREMYEAVRANATSEQIRGKVLLNLGIISNIEGDVAAAERQYHAASKSFEAASDLLGQAQAHHNLGMLHADRLEWDEADDAYERALDLARLTGNQEMIGLVTMNRSELSCAMGRYDEAIERCDAALGIFDEIGAEILRGTTLRWKGRAQRELAQYSAAERSLTEGMRIAHRAQAKLLEAEIMLELGGMLSLSGDRGAAKKWLGRALDLFTSLGATREAEEVAADLKAIETGD